MIRQIASRSENRNTGEPRRQFSAVAAKRAGTFLTQRPQRSRRGRREALSGTRNFREADGRSVKSRPFSNPLRVPLCSSSVSSVVKNERLNRVERRGFSLLEVILSLAILSASLAVLGQLIQIGMTHARQAEDMTQAVILCESIMAEIVCGARTPTAEFASPCDDDPNFLYSITADAGDQVGLLNVHVIVERDPSSTVQPVSCELVRLMADPDYVASLSESAATSQ
jgi:prepilin-type N-terminal cleavage/methylation domain-containing protein